MIVLVVDNKKHKDDGKTSARIHIRFATSKETSMDSAVVISDRENIRGALRGYSIQSMSVSEQLLSSLTFSPSVDENVFQTKHLK
ncbi:unnamed protein product [Colias eurytheme]|nr:unnamed protein product [Colias eurytheme]